MSGWCKVHSCSELRKLKLRKASMLVSGGNKLSSVCGESASIASDTPGLCSPVPIAGDFGGVSSSSDLVTTAVCRGDKSHSDAVLYSLARCSPMTLNRAALRLVILNEVQLAGTLISRSFITM